MAKKQKQFSFIFNGILHEGDSEKSRLARTLFDNLLKKSEEFFEPCRSNRYIGPRLEDGATTLYEKLCDAVMRDCLSAFLNWPILTTSPCFHF